MCENILVVEEGEKLDDGEDANSLIFYSGNLSCLLHMPSIELDPLACT